eukprot:scaffold4990_cov387-Prasinococcus_capsulatus_cf.AAC.17
MSPGGESACAYIAPRHMRPRWHTSSGSSRRRRDSPCGQSRALVVGGAAALAQRVTTMARARARWLRGLR